MTLTVVITITAAVVALAAVGRRALAAHRGRVARELHDSHVRLRRRMVDMARRNGEVETVVRAETTWGWVWLAATRHPGAVAPACGWAPTERLARRRLDAFRGRKTGAAHRETGHVPIRPTRRPAPAPEHRVVRRPRR